MTDWAIPQQAKLKYTQLFNLHDRSRSGFLSGLQCRDILMQSGLPRTILAEIWNLSDIDGDGQLTREEFILAMHLTNQARAGQTLPQELPFDLVPPSYRRTRSISTTSVHSASSSVGSSEPIPPAVASMTATSSSTNDDQLSQKSTETSAGSILNTNSFEDKRRENFEKGRAELERRRLKIIEQQSSIISEQLVKCKKQVAEAKSKIDSMRSERDTKAGLITSLEAQLQTIRERKAFLEHEEMQIIAIARDLNLVNSPNSAELDQQATIAKQASIKQMKEKLVELEQQRDSTVEQLAEAQAKLDESKKELKVVSGEVSKTYETYKDKIANAKVLRQQFIEENKSKPIDLESVWDSTPTQAVSHDTAFKTEPISSLPPSADPWSTTSTFSDPKQPFDDPFSFDGNKSVTQTVVAPLNNNDTNFEVARDFNSFSSISPEQKEQSANMASNSFNESSAPELTQRKKMYRALYEFEARNPDELTINPGDIIIGSEVVCEPGWLSGETHGRSGLFPEAYVEPFVADEKTAPVSNSQPNLSMTADLINNQGSSGGSSQDPQRQASPSKSTIVKYKVIYAFEARNPDELTINPGDIITGVDLPHEPGWLMGELNAQRGLFPEAYVERLAEAQIDPTEPIGKSRGKKAEVATVIANYRALGQEQLNLEKGQLVLIRRKMDSGWWEGELQIKVASSKDGNELDHLIGELVDSELDYVNDLRLCQNAYIKPLSASFDVSQIFTNWSQLIEKHDWVLQRIYEESCVSDEVSGRLNVGRLECCFLFETFQMLLNSIADLYVDFCSHQLDAARQLDSKMASDIRFRQLVNESQRKLRKLIENNNNNSGSLMGPDDDHQFDQSIERALRNSNLPLTTFLLKPMQRITKYELLFDRMLKLLVESQRHVSLIDSTSSQLHTMQNQLNNLKDSAQMLCKQVNEACRLKEDEQDNSKRLRWCQSHILQPAAGQTSALSEQTRSYSICGSPMLGGSEMRISSSEFMRSQSSSDSLAHNSEANPVEQIQFESKTNCLGPRRLLKAGSLCKIRSNRELVVYLFNDFILLTQIKGGVSLRVPDVFRSERAQQAYYKYYRQPILLEDIQMSNFDNDQLELLGQPTSLMTCPSLVAPVSLTKDQENLVVSFLDRKWGVIHNLVAMSPAERENWTELMTKAIERAQKGRIELQSQNLVRAVRRLEIGDCLGRLFVTVLELVQISTPINSIMDNRNSWNKQVCFSGNGVQNLCIRLQLQLYKKAQMILNDSERCEIIPMSDEFKTKPIAVGQALHQPAMVDMSETSMSNLDNQQRDVYKFSDTDCTQFLLSASHDKAEGLEYLEIELVEDSRFRETRQLGRKRISLDQLLGRNHYQNQDKSPNTSRQNLSSIRSGRGVQPLQPNRPVEMTLKLKTIASVDNSNQMNGGDSSAKARLVASGRNGHHQTQLTKFNVKLRLHLQVFCDTNNLT